MGIMNRRQFVQGTTIAASLISPVLSGKGGKESKDEQDRNLMAGLFRRARSPVYFRDLDHCRPRSALTRRGKRFCWRLIDYETDRFPGVMLFAGQETETPEVTYPLVVKGWHDIYIGMFNTQGRAYEALGFWAKLKDDPAYSFLYVEKPGGKVDPTAQRSGSVPLDDALKGPRLQDVYWKTADLTGQTLSFNQACSLVVPQSQQYGNVCGKVWVAYIKLVPLSEEELRALFQDRSRTDTKRLFGYHDSWSPHWNRTGSAGTSEASIQADLEPLRHSDFARIYWDGVHGDICNYFTKIGRMWTPEHTRLEDYPRVGDRLLLESWSDYVRRGIDPFQVAVDFSHEIGLEFHACYRLGWGLFYSPPPFEGVNRGGFYGKHPELRCVRRDGRAGSAVSMAFPETRRFMLSLVGEMAKYPIDGMCILYNRQPPFVDYEAPLVEGFKEEYGEDPRVLEKEDVRWLTYRSRAVTEFMRQLRATLDEAQKGREGRQRMTISAWVFSSERENLYYGVDVEKWVKEGLVDTLIPYTSLPKLFSWALAWEDPKDVEYWVELTRESSCQLALNVMPRNLEASQYRRKAQALYEAGVEYLAFWDTAIKGSSSSPVLKRLGHKDEIAAWIKAGEPPLEFPAIPLRRLGDWDMSFLPE